MRKSCCDANCIGWSYAASAFWNTIRDSLKCLKPNILTVPLFITLTETHPISISLHCKSPLCYRFTSAPQLPLILKAGGEHERHNQTRGIRAVTGARRMQSDIRNAAEPDPRVLCPSYRQSYPFNSLWLLITHKQKNNAGIVNLGDGWLLEYSDNMTILLMVWYLIWCTFWVKPLWEQENRTYHVKSW